MYSSAFLSLIACLIGLTTVGQTPGADGYLIRVTDSAADRYGYRDQAGNMIIPFGQYPGCYTDTFRSYAIVMLKAEKGFFGIDRREKVLYSVFIFDNGPDYPSNGLFRITVGGKIGYADAVTGEVVIEPKFSCAWPFEQGKAKVAINCAVQRAGEHSTWVSDNWFYIDKRGKRTDGP
jgi:hypothetical protein